jgi:hypothetical protein
VILGPAPILAAIVGLFHVSAYVFIRGHAGARLPMLIVAAILGAWAGDTVGARMAIDPIRVGDFHLLTASVVAWVGIGLVVILAVLVPPRLAKSRATRVSTTLRRPKSATPSTTEPEPQAPST